MSEAEVDRDMHALGRKLSALSEAEDPRTACNALLICLKVAIMNMGDFDAATVEEQIPGFLHDVFEKRRLLRQPGAGHA